MPPTAPSTVNVPWQIMEQLFPFFHQFNDANPNTNVDTSSNNPPRTRDITCEVDETISVASEQPAGLTSQHLSIIMSNPATSATVQLTQAPTLIQSTANQLLTLTSVSTLAQPVATQSSLPPVPLCIRDRIICSEFVDFASLLPKAMFSGTLKPELVGHLWFSWPPQVMTY